MEHTIQETLMAILASQGQHDKAKAALASTSRLQWERLVDIAIRTAPEHNRTYVAHTLKLALDARENGGPGCAQDFVIKPERNICRGEVWYRAYRVARYTAGNELIEIGMYHWDIEFIKRRIVGLYTARLIDVQEG